jgi:hypothetical protein
MAAYGIIVAPLCVYRLSIWFIKYLVSAEWLNVHSDSHAALSECMLRL